MSLCVDLNKPCPSSLFCSPTFTPPPLSLCFTLFLSLVLLSFFLDPSGKLKEYDTIRSADATVYWSQQTLVNHKQTEVCVINKNR